MNGDRLSHGLWEASAPAAPALQALSRAIQVDVAVVGGGFTGLSTALHCAQAGASVAVLEAFDVGYGGSGRNVGLVNAGMWVMPEQLPGELGDVYGARLLTLLGDAPTLVFELIETHGMACEAVRQGTLHCAVGAAGLKDITERSRQWQALGAPVQVLNARETAEKTGTQAYSGALLDLRAGTVQPLAYARGLARAALQAGAQIYTGTRVASVQDQGGRWLLTTEGRGSVSANHVVVATNAYTPEGSPWGALQTELVKLPYFNLATQPLSTEQLRTILPERQGAWDTEEILSSLRLDQAGRLVFGSVGALRGQGHGIHRNWGRRALQKLYPQLADVSFEHEWFGWIGMTPNNLPRFHRLARNTYSFSGYNGRGIAPGTTFGREMARLVLGTTDAAAMPLPVTEVAPTPWRRVKGQYYEQGASLAHLVAARL
jgi:glycine/D-amino acid oxidase-like deaminating enzyme